MNRLLQFLRDELTPFPGRMNVTLRCLVCAAIVVVASMTLQVPDLAVSLIVVYYVTQSNAVLTRVIGILFFAGATLAVFSTIFILKLTFDYPLLRIVLASVIFFCCVYAMRIFQFGIVFFVAAIVVIYVQTFVDVTQDAEGIVRATLWVWAAVAYPVAVALIINTLLLPAEPRQQLRRTMVSKLSAVQERLNALLGGTSELKAITAHDVEAVATSLQKLLRFTAMRGKRDEIAEARDLATVTTVSDLYVAASNLQPASVISQSFVRTVGSLRDACRTLSDSILRDEPFSISVQKTRSTLSLTPAIGMSWVLVSMSRALLELDAFTASQVRPMHSAPKLPVLAPDALSNPVYLEFSLKTLLAVLVCYLFYNSVHWQGIHTVMLTCLIVAQPGLGASSRRSLLRFWGAVIGSLLALIVVVFILPRIDGIAALLVTVLPVFFIGAWIAAGSERISYAGVQLMFTFSLAFLEQFAPTFDLTEIRDRMVGIFLGIAVATFVQMSLWPEGEAALLRRRLSASLISTAGLLSLERSGVDEGVGETDSTLGRQRMTAWAALNECEGLLLRVALEPTWREGEEERITLRADSLLAAARELLLAADALRSAFDVAESRISAVLRDAVRDFAANARSDIMEYAAGLIEAKPGAKAPRFSHDILSVDAGKLAGGMRGSAAELIAEVDSVRRAVSNLPDWSGEARSFPLTLPTGARNE